MTRLIVVNEQDEVLAFKEKADILPEDIHRVSALWLTNSRGEILLARRSLNKKNEPGKWGPAASGTYEEGETYESNILKETEEEIGLRLRSDQLTLGPKRLSEGVNFYFCQWYFATVDMPLEAFVLEPKEVMEICWVSNDELRRRLETAPETFIKTAPVTYSELMGWM